MHNVFFHITGLALFEILFYFYYIGPIETKLFEQTVNNMLNKISSNEGVSPFKLIYSLNQNYSTFNYTNFNFTYGYDMDKYIIHLTNKVNDKKDERYQNNYNLFKHTMYLWSFLCIFSITYYIAFYLFYYKAFPWMKIKDDENKPNSIVLEPELQLTSAHNGNSSEIELGRISQATGKSYNVCSRYNLNDNNDNNDNNAVHYKRLYKFIKLCLLVILVISFETAFFQYIVLKYDIISFEELEFVVFRHMYPMLQYYVGHNEQKYFK